MLMLTFVNQWPTTWQRAVEKGFAALQDKLADIPTGTINLKLVDDEEIAKLNLNSSGQGYATDVLTFNYQEDKAETYGELADIVISSDTAERQAAAAGTAVTDEIALLAIHGILHVLGYDHAKSDEKNKLDQLQAAIMDTAGLTYRDFQWTK